MGEKSKRRDYTPEQYARKLEQNRAARARSNADPARRAARLAKQKASSALHYLANAEALREKARESSRTRGPRDPEKTRVYRRRYREKLKADPDRFAVFREYQNAWNRKAWGKRTPAQQRARNVRLQAVRDALRRPDAPAGSVLATAAESPWRAILAEITALVPRLDDRDEIIAQAALHVIEGQTVAEAVASARQSVLRESRPFRYARPIDECSHI